MQARTDEMQVTCNDRKVNIDEDTSNYNNINDNETTLNNNQMASSVYAIHAHTHEIASVLHAKQVNARELVANATYIAVHYIEMTTDYKALQLNFIALQQMPNTCNSMQMIWHEMTMICQHKTVV